jgi:hypothetical protein
MKFGTSIKIQLNRVWDNESQLYIQNFFDISSVTCYYPKCISNKLN